MIESAARLKSLTPTNRVSPEKEDGIVFAIDTAKSKSAHGGEIYFIRVRIGSKVAAKAKLKAGSKVDLRWDRENKTGYLVPDKEGWILSGLKRTKDDKPGTQALQLRFTWHPRSPSVSEPRLCKDATIIKFEDTQSIQFKYPEDTSFETLAPQKSAKPVEFNRRASDKGNSSEELTQ